MTWPVALTEHLQAQGLGAIRTARAVEGGCINDGHILTTETGATFFVKQNYTAPADLFSCEAAGLAALANAPGGPRTPQVYFCQPGLLLLEYLAPAQPHPAHWEIFGRELANLHLHTAQQFGFSGDNYIGSTPQPNPPTENGFDFFAEHRLIYQARLAHRHGLLPADDLQRAEKLAARLPHLVPAQPASLLHGDLWRGNIHTGPQGCACLIDPAAHFGWAEADLAMTDLFGRLPASFYNGYENTRPLEPGYRQRYPIYNLYHLLNHLNLFGTGYLAQVQSVLQLYT